ncbi:MAG: tsaB [Bacteroidetes bacterium]|nr:tsaB [Bacteroidota bacterium]
MAFILNIETATPVCSVALAEDDRIIAIQESSEEKSHAEKLMVFIEEMLTEQHLSVRELNAIAIGKGPGSYTGLRIGVATAKGLSYGAKIPLLAVSTLETMVQCALQKIKKEHPAVLLDENTILCPMIDARRMEVYMALFDHEGNRKQQDKAVVIDVHTFSMISPAQNLVYFGSGAAKCRELISWKNSRFMDGIYPSAGAMVSKSFRLYRDNIYENTAYFEPYYLKDFIATTARKNILIRSTK